MKAKKILKLLSSIIVCQLAGVAGSFFTSPAVPYWYASLEKPSFNPPDWVFSPVWIILFVFMGISLFLLWEEELSDRNVKMALFIFFIQLGLNICWSIIFFGFKSPFFAFIEIVFLWIAILFTILTSFRVSKPAGTLLIPYFLWVSFAAVLNYFIWHLNS